MRNIYNIIASKIQDLFVGIMVPCVIEFKSLELGILKL